MLRTSGSVGVLPASALGSMVPISAMPVERPCSPDIILGAYLVTHLQQRCENCGITDTPQWRKGWFSTILNRSVVLCNACGLKYNKNQFCPYCMYVYYKEEDKKLKNSWLICESCQRWVHVECEQQNGGKEHVAHWNKNHSYLCPGCRNNNGAGMIQSFNNNSGNAMMNNETVSSPSHHSHHYQMMPSSPVSSPSSPYPQFNKSFSSDVSMEDVQMAEASSD